MVDPTTTNRSFNIPTHGSDVDTWDVPVNANMALLDTILGGQQTVAATNGGAVILNATQLSGGLITITGAIPANATITFPAVQGWWSIYNTTTAGVLIINSVGATERIGVPPGVITDIQVIGTVIKFRNFPMIGSFLDYPAASVPTWITAGCTIPPFLLCDGSTFSAVTYPYLNTVLGGNTLPDFRGRSVHYLNGGTGRLTAAGAGIDGDTLGATGGNNGVTLAINQVPTLTSSNASQSITVSDTRYWPIIAQAAQPNWANFNAAAGGTQAVPYTGGISNTITSVNSLTTANSISVTYTNVSQQIIGNAAPGIVTGIRMIRAG